MPRNTPQQYRAPALEKGLDLIELLARTPRPLSTSEIIRTLGRSRNEIFRMQNVLEHRGYIARDDVGDGFKLTTKLFEMAMQSPPTAYLLRTALPIMEHLAEDSRQSVHLAVVSGNQIVVIARVESPTDVGFSVRIGHRRSLVDSTSGRVLLAFQPDSTLNTWLQQMAEENSFSIEQVHRDLKRIRKLGHRRAPSTFVEGITDLGAPVFTTGTSSAIAALSIPYVKRRIKTDHPSIKIVVDLLCKSATQISSKLAAHQC